MTLIWTLFIITIISVHTEAAKIECSTAGFMCREKCTELVRCVGSGNNSLTEQVVRKCPGTIGNYCNVSDLECTGTSCKDGDLDSVPYVSCHEDGYYPDPVKCDKYYLCTNNILSTFICPSNTSYNAIWNNCTNPSTARACQTTPIPRCETISDIGAYSQDPSVYYICAYDQYGYLRPELHRCQKEYYFYNEHRTCLFGLNSASHLLINFSLLTIISIFYVFF